MSEGELKKRNKDLVIQLRFYHWTEIHKIQSLFDDWIAEAKKEFPNFKSIIQQFQEGNTWIPNDFPSTEACRDMIIWFLKWFGTEKKVRA